MWRDYVFEDFAKCTGATIVEDATGLSFKNLQLSHLGTCGKLIVDEDETVVIGTKDISEHIASLKSKADDDSLLRLSWLTNKSVILKIGANSETDLSYKRLKFSDAIRSSQLALKYGTVTGGGMALKTASDALPDTIAGNIMKVALKAPRTQICANAGWPELMLPYKNIVDSAAVVKSAVRNAIGIASTVLTSSALIYIPEPSELEIKLLEINKQHHAF